MGQEEDTVRSRAVSSPSRRTRPLAPLVAIVRRRVGLGIALGLLIDWFPVAGLDAGRRHRHALRRPDHRLGADLRARRDRRPLLRLQVRDAPGRGGHGRPADPRQHAPGGHLDRRSRRSCSSRSCAYAYVGSTTSRRRKADAMQVRVVGEQFAWTFFYPAPSRAARRSPSKQLYLPVGRRSSSSPVQGRPARLLGAGLPHEDRRGAGHQTNATASTPNRRGNYPIVCAELCGLGHAMMR